MVEEKKNYKSPGVRGEFLYFPQYAKFLLDFKLKEYSMGMLEVSRALDLPLLRYFSHVSNDELVAMGMESNRKLFSQIVDNKFDEIIENSTKAWVANQLPMVERDQVVAEDIGMVSFARRKVLRDLLPAYSKDIDQFRLVIEEIDRFTLMQDMALFSTFIKLEQEKIKGINAALQTREAELLEAQDIAQIGSFEWDLTGKNSRYTAQVFKLFEFEQTSSLPSFMEDVHPEDRERLRAAIAKGLQDGNFDCEYRYTRNGKQKVLWSRGKGVIVDGKVIRMVGTVMDVTERSRTIERLQRSEELHKQAQALTHIGNWSWDIDKNQVNWSDEMYRIYGLEPQSEVITLEKFLSFVHPDDKERRLADIRKSLETGVVEEYYFKIVANGGAVKVLRGRGDVKTNKDNQPITLTGTCQDITKEYQLNLELKEHGEYTAKLNTSLEQKNEELRRTNTELESFNFVASHDLKEPLRKIRLFSDLVLNESVELPGSTRTYVQKMHQAAGRMQKLIDDFLSFSRTGSGPQAFEPTNLKEIIAEIKIDLAGQIEEKQATIKTSKLPVIDAIPFQIRQLLTNLISNSLKYSRKGVKPRITVSVKTVTGKELNLEGEGAKKKFRRISVVDNGIGFKQKYADKIFELFQRLHTKEMYSGTGIGLAICKKIVDNHHGYIMAFGTEKEGAEFLVYLPL